MPHKLLRRWSIGTQQFPDDTDLIGFEPDLVTLESIQPALKSEFIREEFIVRPELTDMADLVLSTGDHLAFSIDEVPDSIGTNQQRADVVGRNVRENLDLEIVRSELGLDQAVRDVRWLVALERPKNRDLPVHHDDTIADCERVRSPRRDKRANHREEEILTDVVVEAPGHAVGERSNVPQSDSSSALEVDRWKRILASRSLVLAHPVTVPRRLLEKRVGENRSADLSTDFARHRRTAPVAYKGNGYVICLFDEASILVILLARKLWFRMVCPSN